MKWKYTDKEKSNAQCYDCGKPYGEKDWHDVVITNELWELINPTFDRGCGLLCGNCMIHRLVKKGIQEITIKIF